jgi:phosphoglycolate phosphatase-like HAD superfamily hydrolase
MKPLGCYQSIVFDCDGVLLDSNSVKTSAFFQAAGVFGSRASEEMVEYHIERGGISRYEKFRWLASQYQPDDIEGAIHRLLLVYADLVKSGLRSCDVASSLEELRAATGGSRWFVVSGGDEGEVVEALRFHGIAHLFDGGIHGSPVDKEHILAREQESGTLVAPGLFLGDSRYDYVAARGARLDFVFVHGWTELPQWEAFVAEHGLPAVSEVADLLSAACD